MLQSIILDNDTRHTIIYHDNGTIWHDTKPRYTAVIVNKPDHMVANPRAAHVAHVAHVAVKSDKPVVNRKFTRMTDRLANEARRKYEDAANRAERAETLGDVDNELHFLEVMARWDREYTDVVGVSISWSAETREKIPYRALAIEDELYGICAAVTYNALKYLYQKRGLPMIADILYGRKPEIWEDMVGQSYWTALELQAEGKLTIGRKEIPANEKRHKPAYVIDRGLIGENADVARVMRAGINWLHSNRIRDELLMRVQAQAKPIDGGVDGEVKLDNLSSLRAWGEAQEAAQAQVNFQILWEKLDKQDRRILKALAHTNQVFSTDKRRYVTRHMTLQEAADACNVTVKTIRAAKARFARLLANNDD